MNHVLIATFGYALMLVGFSRGPLYTNPHLVGVLINCVGAFVPFVLFVSTGMRLDGVNDFKGICWALAAGVGIAAFTLAMARIFSLGENLGFVTPLVYGGSLVLVTIAGTMMFRERIALLQLCGLILVVTGIACIAFSRLQEPPGSG